MQLKSEAPGDGSFFDSQLSPQLRGSVVGCLHTRALAQVGSCEAVEEWSVLQQWRRMCGRREDRCRDGQVRSKSIVCHAQERAGVRTGRIENRQLAFAGERKVRGAQPAPERSWVLRGVQQADAEAALGTVAVATIAGERSQAQQGLARHGVAGRRGIVLEVLGPDEQGFSLARCVEETALWIVEASDHLFGQFACRDKPLIVEAGLVQIKQSQDQGGVILEEDVIAGPAIAPNASQTVWQGEVG